MTCPSMRYDDFMRMAKSLGCMGVHYRNDLGRPLFEGDSNEQVRQQADTSQCSLTVLPSWDVSTKGTLSVRSKQLC